MKEDVELTCRVTSVTIRSVVFILVNFKIKTNLSNEHNLLKFQYKAVARLSNASSDHVSHKRLSVLFKVVLKVEAVV